MATNALTRSCVVVFRNAMLMRAGMKMPTATKTGTTIVGLVTKDAVVLGADTRATGGSTVADKNCEKIHYMAPNIWCCGAGTAADTENTTGRQLCVAERHTREIAHMMCVWFHDAQG